ncbi:ATP-binding protein [Larkinella bovis]|uniref:ATP-binding protein n=1 Tax=Larkinella bovis TaxID=683041 RepID=A0ABW0IBB9_9BACT
MTKFKYGYKAFIKDVFLELPDYKFNHNPIEGNGDTGNENKEIFIGRRAIENQLLNILKFSGANGSYLVTGYRGMGKTSFVKRVLAIYAKHRKINKRTDIAIENNVKQIKISFAQSDLNEKDILKQITSKLIYYCEQNFFVKLRGTFSFFNILIGSFVLLLGLLIYIKPLKYTKSLGDENVDSFKNSDSVRVEMTSIELDSLINNRLKIDSINGVIRARIESKRLEYFRESHKILNWVPFVYFSDEYIRLVDFFKDEKKSILEDDLDKKFGAILLLIIISFLLSCIIYAIKNILEQIVLRFPTFKYTKYFKEKIVIEQMLYKRLVELEENINASLTKETGMQSMSEKMPFGFFNKSTKSYAILNSKEIETELISILDQYNSFETYINEFVVVFDELDKVEPGLGKGFYNEKEDVIQNDRFANLKMDKTKNRREAIINILSSLKYFVTEAKAKFIFIAGREMFDASLADISDRESFISSIFHQIIYVDSFLKESVYPNSGGNTLSAMAELYLSHILIPEGFNTGGNFLRDYYNYINTQHKELNFRGLSSSDYQKELLKVIYTLQTFIVFLTYRSNGSPKKIVRIIEEYVISEDHPKYNKPHYHNVIIKRKNNKPKLFLSFSYKNQYHFGFITYLYRPFLMSQSVVLKDFSDNILVSTPYLMDHILKYHPFAFSTQNLELIPEVFTNNRNPLFRYFVDELIKYLNINHLRETEIGMFDYKFLSRTTNEIKYLSKIFEDELAAFNFSLDEMFYVKHHLKEKILEIRNNYNISLIDSGNQEFIRSICFLNGLLGDAYYFDQEYDNACVAYSDGIQFLPIAKQPNLDISINITVFKLKLGLIHERMGNFENAVGYYTDCMNQLQTITENDSPYYNKRNQEIIKLYNLACSAYLCIIEKYNYNGVSYDWIEKTIIAFDNLFTKCDYKAEALLIKADFLNNIAGLLYYKNFSVLTFSITRTNHLLHRIINNDDIFNTLQGSLGVEDSNHILIEEKKQYKGRFKALSNQITHLSDVKHKGSKWIYVFKNGLYANENRKLSSKIVSLKNKDEQFSEMALEFYRVSLYNCLQSVNNIPRKYFKDITETSSLKKLISCASSLLFDRRTNISKNTLKVLGFTLSCLGDCIFSGIKDNEIKESEHYLKNFWDIFEDLSNTFTNNETRKKRWDIITDKYFLGVYNGKIARSELVTFTIFTYYLSGRFNSKAGLLTSFGIQLKKILLLLNRFNVNSDGKQINLFNRYHNIYTEIETSLLAMLLEVASWNSDSTDRPQIYKFKNVITSIEGMPHPDEFARNNYTNISNSPDVKEALLLFAKFKLRSKDYPVIKGDSLDEIIRNIPETVLINQYQTISSKMTRMLEMDVMSIINDEILKVYFEEIVDWKDQPFRFFKRNKIEIDEIGHRIDLKAFSLAGESEFYNFLEKFILVPGFQKKKVDFKNIVINSVFCLLEMIQTIDIYGVNPYVSNSFKAACHAKLGRWLKYYELSRLIDLIDGVKKEDPYETKNLIESMVGEGTMVIHDSTSHFQIALKYLHRAKEFHKNGKEYDNYLRSNLIFLEGSYDDEMYHFGIALERQSLNNGSIRERIKDLEKEIADSPLLKYQKYANNTPI